MAVISDELIEEERVAQEAVERAARALTKAEEHCATVRERWQNAKKAVDDAFETSVGRKSAGRWY